MSRTYNQSEMEPIYGFFHYLALSAYDILYRGNVVGLEHLPHEGSFLIAANHISFLDPPFIGCQVQRQISYFARKTLWKGGIVSWWLDTVGTIPVDRDGGQDVSAIKRVLKVLKEDRGLILFPEGTRSPTGQLQAPKAGVGLICCRAQVPVVPARIFGSYEAFGKGRGLRLGVPVSVVFGPPLAPSDYDEPNAGKERYQIASERIMRRIAELRPPEIRVI
ncbi:MAG TPA: lysophospholipid acyltransferase family protein [Opitutaceae bacterium]|nr:lysophospholipid acyltransferase family protein [Opitutaceae bacterium]HND61693.1 lysophospholipid acyltransferase family protein [Opitutaceae bacterium]